MDTVSEEKGRVAEKNIIIAIINNNENDEIIKKLLLNIINSNTLKALSITNKNKYKEKIITDTDVRSDIEKYKKNTQNIMIKYPTSIDKIVW